MSRILIIGNFGFEKNNLNGQTVRTRTVYRSLVNKLKEYNIKYFDTDSIDIRSLFNNIQKFIELISEIKRATCIIIMPAQRTIKYILPLLSILGVSNKVIMVAIGGWLYDVAIINNIIKKELIKLHSILVQTESLEDKLKSIGIDQVKLFPNYRINDKTVLENVHVKNKLKKIVYYSRVMPEKGIEEAIKAIIEINNDYNYELFLDIYGPIKINYEGRINELISKYNFIKYKGVLDENNIIPILDQYDCLLFPTYYEGEGFPGTVLEAMLSGVPIIASDWKYNKELIFDNYSGYIVPTKNVKAIIDRLCMLKLDSELLKKLSENCIKESKKYHENEVIKILLDDIEGINGKNK